MVTPLVLCCASLCTDLEGDSSEKSVGRGGEGEERGGEKGVVVWSGVWWAKGDIEWNIVLCVAS